MCVIRIFDVNFLVLPHEDKRNTRQRRFKSEIYLLFFFFFCPDAVVFWETTSVYLPQMVFQAFTLLVA